MLAADLLDEGTPADRTSHSGIIIGCLRADGLNTAVRVAGLKNNQLFARIHFSRICGRRLLG